MKYKINALKDVKMVALITSLIMIFPFTIMLLVFGMIESDTDCYLIAFIWFVIGCIISLFIFCSVQWYCVYEDKIVVKNYFGVVNEVYFFQVHQIVDIELPIVKRDYVRCFVFVDKKKNIKDKIFWGSVYNSKYSFIRVPVTDELITTIDEAGLTDKIYVAKKLF